MCPPSVERVRSQLKSSIPARQPETRPGQAGPRQSSVGPPGQATIRGIYMVSMMRSGQALATISNQNEHTFADRAFARVPRLQFTTFARFCGISVSQKRKFSVGRLDHGRDVF